MYIPPATHVSALATIHRDRLLPQPGYVLAHEGDRVEAHDVVAKGEVGGRHHIFDLTRRLQAPPAQAEKFVRVKEGAALDKGDVIASRSTMLGLSKLTVRAPAKGTVVAIGGGKVLFAASGAPLDLRAGFPGVVVSVRAEWGVTIETTGALVQGVWGSGRQEYGVLKCAAGDHSRIMSADSIDVSFRGAIAATAAIDEEGLRMAETIQVRALIVGSMPSRLIALVRHLSFPVLVTDGFGMGGMTPPAWVLLNSGNGREALFDATPADRWSGHCPEVIIPLPSAGTPPTPADAAPLEAGRRVRVVSPPHVGAVGVVKQILPRAQLLPSGVQAQSAQVELDGAVAEILPLANLELFE